MELVPARETVRLTRTHPMVLEGSQFIEAVPDGWSSNLSSLKSRFGTGQVLRIA